MLKAIARLFGAGRDPVPVNASVAALPPEDAPALLVGPVEALKAGRPEEAVQLLEAVIESHPEFADAHLMLGTILHQQKRYEDARDSYLLASCFRTDWWAPHLQMGLLAIDHGRFTEAAPALARAVELGAAGARVQTALGAVYLHTGKPRAAVECFRTALALEPAHVPALSNLGYALFRELEEYDEGARHIERALELAPDNIAAACNRIMVLHHRGLTDDALALSDRLLSREPQLSEARLNRALMLLTKGDFERAWDDYEARRQSPGGSCGDDLRWPEWDGSSLVGRSIFAYGEQGLGDEIMFASCLPDLIAVAKACTIECNARLAKIFRRSFPEAAILTKGAWRDSSLASRPPDWKVATGSLPRFFRRSRASFPPHRGYLRADPASVSYWKGKLEALPGRRTVGISWRGGLATTRRTVRSIPLEQWLPIVTLPGITFVSLQYADPESEIDALHRSAGVRLHHWSEAITDYDQTAALVEALDLVVSVQTAVVHLAGALGKPAWVLIPAVPEWRYGATDDTLPWYPQVRVVRQSRIGEWDPVMAAVAQDLQAWSEPAGS